MAVQAGAPITRRDLDPIFQVVARARERLGAMVDAYAVFKTTNADDILTARRAFDEGAEDVSVFTTERARKVLLRDYQRAARAHESEAERLQQQLNRFLSTERKRGGSASGAAAAAGDSRPGTAATMPPTSARGVSPTALPNLAAAERGALSARIPRGRTTRSMAVGAQMAGVGLGG